MFRWFLILFLFAHALVHFTVWGPETNTFGAVPSRSWLLGERHRVAVALAAIAALLFGLAGIGLILKAAWWGGMTVAGALVSLALTALFTEPFKPRVWLLAPLLINLGLVLGVTVFSWRTLETFGG
jgi:hypothetical protein